MFLGNKQCITSRVAWSGVEEMDMAFWIDHPSQSCPVSVTRWAKWKVSVWLAHISVRLEWEALYPNCEACGQPRNKGDHSHCDEIPF
jgi:hypothetical protein